MFASLAVTILRRPDPPKEREWYQRPSP